MNDTPKMGAGFFGMLTAVALGISLAACDGGRPTDPLVAGTGGKMPTDPPPKPRDSSSTTSGASLSVTFIWSADRGMRLIPVAPGDIGIGAVDINDMGEVVGMLVDQGGSYREGFVWSEAEGMRKTGRLDTFNGAVIPTAINSTGTAVGYVAPYTGSDVRAFVWTTDSGFTPPAGELFAAMSINDAGWIVGNDSSGPVRWHKDAGFTALPLTTAECTAPIAINGKNEVLGWSGNDLNGWGCHPSAWWISRNFSAPVEIMRCTDPDHCNKELLAFNDRGDVVGNVADTTFRMSIIGIRSASLAGARARDINANGDIVGLTLPFETSRPFLWKPTGELTLLPLPEGKSRGAATAINNRGEVIGWAY